jgi:glycine hydroxymethyltransferase
MKEDDMEKVAAWIHAAIENRNDSTKLAEIQTEVHTFAETFPLYD